MSRRETGNHARTLPASVLALALLATAPGVAAEGEAPIRAEFWIDLEPVSAAGDPWPVDEATAAARLLEDAAWVFAGMAEGFDFEWTPSDIARRVEERFELVPAGIIRPGDPRVLPGPARRVGDRLYGWVEFRPDPYDAARLEARRYGPWKSSQGNGGAELWRGWAGRREAMVDAIREAIRASLRGSEPNKPRLVRGRACLASAPVLGVSEGRYVAKARVRIEVLEVLEYGVY